MFKTPPRQACTRARALLQIEVGRIRKSTLSMTDGMRTTLAEIKRRIRPSLITLVSVRGLSYTFSLINNAAELYVLASEREQGVIEYCRRQTDGTEDYFYDIVDI